MSKYFKTPFAESGDKSIIPDASQPNGDVSYEEGWTPDYAKDQTTDANAKDVSRQSENSFKFDVTDALKEIQEYGYKPYDILVNYPINAINIGSDGDEYEARKINGPDSAVINPVGDVTGVWFNRTRPKIYNEFINYAIPDESIGSDGDTYQTLIPNGPDTAEVDPVGDTTGTWLKVKPLYNAYLKFSDKKTAGTGGGASSSLTTHVRDITSEDSDDANIGSFLGNQITLEKGTYRALISCPAYKASRTRVHLYDTTGAQILVLGSSLFTNSADAVAITAKAADKFVLTVQSVLEIRQFFSEGNTDGMGIACSDGHGDEVYTVIELFREVE